MGVDSVEVAGGLTAISLDAGSLGALLPASLPQFDVAQSDGALDVTLDIAAGGGALLAGVADPTGLIAGLGAAGIDHIDLGGSDAIAAAQISGAQAAQLVAAGIDFADDDVVTVAATQLSTNLQALQTLGVDSVSIVGGATAIGIDAGNFAALSPIGLPQFDVAQGDGALEVTLNVTPGAPGDLFAGVADPLDLIDALGDAGIDRIDVDGGGTIGSVTIDQAQAEALIAAGIDFADNDVVTISAAATHLSNNLQSLQALGVDSVAVVGGLTVIDVDAGSLAALSPSGLPQFDVAQADGALDVTLNVAGGDLFAGASDPLALITALGNAGIDHLDVDGDAALGSTQISEAEAGSLVAAGIDFDGSDTINLVSAGTQLGTSLSQLQTLGVDTVTTTSELGLLTLDAGVTGAGLDGEGLANLLGGALPAFDDALDVTLSFGATAFDGVDVGALASALSSAGIDHLDVDGMGVLAPISEAQANMLIGAGLDFAADDGITMMAAAGTQLATTLHDLQNLGVDSVATGSSLLTVQLGGGIDGLAALPQFDVAQSDGAVDVTLEIGAAALAAQADLGTLLGVDVLSGLTTPDLYGDLIDALLTAGIDRLDISSSGRVELTDGLADVLIAFEGFTADDAELVLNAAGSGDHLRTSLHEMAHLGVDVVELDDQGADPVYVDFGDGPLDETTLLGMLDALDSDDNDSTPLFTGSAEVALVVDQATAEAIAQASGALDKLAELGFTEITVLDGIDNGFIGLLESGPLEVRLIGQDDELYDYLHH